MILAVVAGCSDGEPPTMPDVVGQQLDVALSDIDRAGISDEAEIIGGGLFGVVDESNWTVCDQLPLAGDAAVEQPRLTVERACGGDSALEGVQTDEDESELETKASEDVAGTGVKEGADGIGDPGVLTRKSSDEMAAVLDERDNCSELIGAFAKKYQGQEIQFNGTFVYMALHGDYSTRYDFLIQQGDVDPSAAGTGPVFQFRDVNIVHDLHLAGDIPETVGQGDRARFTAEVSEYNPDTCVLQLRPVRTVIRR
ncbi:uncharacterized protein DUF4839 [Isoptericola jiangsuensis]|uniref:Uncharacterized protein DUF4839 n=1 Tax=Isoptericola jiangsuensis TaxID=548579 RepID=A0A2A9ES87_9MICO|nr:DUF4839 domain-containing protein [Isoptericola jiangsuensis]PFG41426.1 uncharacterized protein DUF4839 [Isoptericola jiangsuensis]